jgi:hypothetical protein
LLGQAQQSDLVLYDLLLVRYIHLTCLRFLS